MIQNWHYDSGDPYYMAAIGKWSNSRLPSWRGQIYELSAGKLVTEWIEKNSTTAEIDYRFNSGRPCYFVTIYNEEEATAFYMTWKK